MRKPRPSRRCTARLASVSRPLFTTRTATLWSTALSDKRAYVTVLHGSTPRARIISVSR